jgi:hypothetical protein
MIAMLRASSEGALRGESSVGIGLDIRQAFSLSVAATGPERKTIDDRIAWGVAYALSAMRILDGRPDRAGREGREG